MTFPNRFLVLLIIALLIAANWSGEIGEWLGGQSAWLHGLPAWFEGHTFVVWTLVLVLPWAIGWGMPQTVHLVLIFLAAYLAPLVFPYFPSFLVDKGSGVAVYFYFALLIGPLRRSLNWLRVGKVDSRSVVVAAAVVGLSVGGLLGWVLWAHPDMAWHARILPAGSSSERMMFMAVFAVTNSLVEEIIYRGVMMSALDAAFGAGWFALIVQAVAFGFAHLRGGFPGGWSGVPLAGLFGLAMGYLRRRSGGMLIPWITHAAADLTVICLIVHFSGKGF